MELALNANLRSIPTYKLFKKAQNVYGMVNIENTRSTYSLTHVHKHRLLSSLFTET